MLPFCEAVRFFFAAAAYAVVSVVAAQRRLF